MKNATTTLDDIRITSRPWFDGETGASSFSFSGLLVTVRRETASVPGETEVPTEQARVEDPVNGNHTSAIRVTDGSDGAALFNLVPATGLNVFSVRVRAPGVNGQGDGPLLPVCGLASSSPTYFKLRSQP